MPHTRSAKKNLRKSEKRRLHNRAVKRDVKTQIKRFLEALEGPAEQLQKEFNLAAKKLDKAAAKGILHRNLAARKKSQLARALHTKAAAEKPSA
jgi:small subunit ribosomal protein S20